MLLQRHYAGAGGGWVGPAEDRDHLGLGERFVHALPFLLERRNFRVRRIASGLESTYLVAMLVACSIQEPLRRQVGGDASAAKQNRLIF